MSKIPVGIGIIGTGFMGRAFAQICCQLPETRLMGVSDIMDTVGRATAGDSMCLTTVTILTLSSDRRFRQLL